MKRLTLLLAIIVTSLFVQAQLVTNTQGTIVMGPYANNSSTFWDLQPTGGGKIYITFDYIDTEQNYDFVSVYDGNPTTGIMRGQFSGLLVPAPIISFGSQVWVSFAADGSVTRSGFKANYYACRDIYTTNTGTVSLINSEYTNNINVRWLITPANATGIELTINSINIESDYDYVRVYDGDPSSPSLIGEFTGSSLPSGKLYSSGQNMLVTFSSDESVSFSDGNTNLTGFSASYTTINSTFGFNYDGAGNCTSRPVLGGGLRSFSILRNFDPQDLKKNKKDKLNDAFVKVYPNPTKGILKVEFTNELSTIPGSLSLIDINGRIVFFSNVLKKDNLIDISKKASGQYILKYEYLNNTKEWTITKE